MSSRRILSGFVMDENFSFSFHEICDFCHLSEAMMMELIESGLFGEVNSPIHELIFDYKMLKRAQSASRLHRDFELQLQGILLVLELLDEIASMREELVILRRNIHD